MRCRSTAGRPDQGEARSAKKACPLGEAVRILRSEDSSVSLEKDGDDRCLSAGSVSTHDADRISGRVAIHRVGVTVTRRAVPDTQQAAIYVGVSVSTFDHEVRIGIWPRGRRRGVKGGRLTWDRALLDAAADRQGGLSAGQTATPTAIETAQVTAWEERLNAAPSLGSQRRPKKAA